MSEKSATVLDGYVIPRIEASCYCYRFPQFTGWKIANEFQSKRIRLSADVNQEEIGSVVAKCFRHNKSHQALSPEKFIEMVINERLDEIARVRFVGPNKLETVNGCCSDFWVWRELHLAKEKFVWLGHDPSPELEYNEKEETVRVWIDSKYRAKNDEENSIVFSWRDFKKNIRRLNEDLKEFVVLLEAWAETISPGQAKRLAEIFEGYLSINKFERF